MKNLTDFLNESIANESIANESLSSKWNDVKKFVLKKFNKDLITNKGSVTVAIYGDDSTKYMDRKFELETSEFKTKFKELEDSINKTIELTIPYKTNTKEQPSVGREIMFYGISDVDADMDELWENLCKNIQNTCDKFSNKQNDIKITNITITNDGITRAMKTTMDIKEIDIDIKYKDINMSIVIDLYVNDYIKR